MGSYLIEINGRFIGTSYREKIESLKNAGAEPVDKKSGEFEENLVIVVDNGLFAAASYAYTEREFEAFLPTTTDNRPRQWFKFDGAKEFAEPKYWED